MLLAPQSDRVCPSEVTKNGPARQRDPAIDSLGALTLVARDTISKFLQQKLLGFFDVACTYPEVGVGRARPEPKRWPQIDSDSVCCFV